MKNLKKFKFNEETGEYQISIHPNLHKRVQAGEVLEFSTDNMVLEPIDDEDIADHKIGYDPADFDDKVDEFENDITEGIDFDNLKLENFGELTVWDKSNPMEEQIKTGKLNLNPRNLRNYIREDD